MVGKRGTKFSAELERLALVYPERWQRLTALQRVIALAVIDGEYPSDLARRIGLTPQRVNTAMHSALRTLRAVPRSPRAPMPTAMQRRVQHIGELKARHPERWAALPARWREVALLRLAGTTPLGVARQFGWTRERARQIERRLVEHLDGTMPAGGTPPSSDSRAERVPRLRRVQRVRGRRATLARKAAAWDALAARHGVFERPGDVTVLAAMRGAARQVGLPDPLDALRAGGASETEAADGGDGRH